MSPALRRTGSAALTAGVYMALLVVSALAWWGVIVALARLLP